MQLITPDNQVVSISHGDFTAVRKTVLDDNGRILELPASAWQQFPWDDVRSFMHEYPVYVLPTTELLDILDDLMQDYEQVIEIGAGTGSIGRLLGINMTDSYLQQDNVLCHPQVPQRHWNWQYVWRRLRAPASRWNP